MGGWLDGWMDGWVGREEVLLAKIQIKTTPIEGKAGAQLLLRLFCVLLVDVDVDDDDCVESLCE